LTDEERFARELRLRQRLYRLARRVRDHEAARAEGMPTDRYREQVERAGAALAEALADVVEGDEG
jgi:hypothetical protein